MEQTIQQLGKERTLLNVLREEKQMGLKGGIYHRTQIDLTYNSNHIEGSRLTHDQTRYIFETNTLGMTDEAVNVDDIVETVNHFCCIDFIIERAEQPLTEDFVKQLHGMLKTGTSDSRRDWFAVGDYKRFPNEVGGCETCPPEEVHEAMETLLSSYHYHYRRVEILLLQGAEPMGAYERLPDRYLPGGARPLQSLAGLFSDSVCAGLNGLMSLFPLHAFAPYPINPYLCAH